MTTEKQKIEDPILQKILEKQKEVLISQGLNKKLVEKISITLGTEQEPSSLLEILREQ